MQKKDYFLGIDVSKLTLDYCLLDQQDTVLSKGVCANSSKGIADLSKALKAAGITDTSLVLFGMENTGLYSNPMKNYAVAKGWDLVVEHPYSIAKSKGLKRGKTDATDAKMIGQYMRKELPNLRLYLPDSEIVIKLKQLQSSRELLLKEKTQTNQHLNEMKGLIDPKSYQSLELALDHAIIGIQKSIVAIDQQIDEIIKSDEDLDNNQEIIESIPGIGRETAIALICATNNFNSITDPRKLACHAGVVPYLNESGTSVNSKPRVSRLANKFLKKRLHMASLSAIRWCLPMKLYYERKVAEGKNKMSIINAVRNKLIHLVYALIEKKQNYDKNYINLLA
jgi:transposase